MTDTGLVLIPEIVSHKNLDFFQGNGTLLSWFKNYLQQEVIGIQSKNTLEAKARDAFGFMRWFEKINGHNEISDWHPRDTKGYLNHLENEGRAATTINRTLATLKRFATWCSLQPNNPFKHGLPTRGIKELVVDEPDCKKLSTRELHRLFKAADNLVTLGNRKNARPKRDRAVLAVLYYTGLRVTELTQLKLSQYKDNYLHEVKRKGRSRSKGVYIPSPCRALLEEYLNTERLKDIGSEESPALFVSTETKYFISRQQVFTALSRIAEEANKHSKDNQIHIHPHRLRHTFGSELLEKTGNLTEVQRALGHESMNYVGRYVRKTQAEREEVLEGFGFERI
jgi:site-specific recombinase XerD